MPESFLSLGSNLGNRRYFIEKATELISREIGTVIKKSSLYETEPWGFHHPITFYNKVLLVNTNFCPEELLLHCLAIEVKLGRTRGKIKYEARYIDIDILFYDSLIYESEQLKIPHPYLHLRRFVLEPMNEISPEYIHPMKKQTIRHLLELCPDRTNVKKLE